MAEVFTQVISCDFVIQVCCQCEMQYALTKPHYERLRRTHEWFYCPAGHHQHYVAESDIQRAEKSAARAQELLDIERRRREEVERQRNSAERSAAISKGLHRSLKKRVANGVCPCCKRSFGNLSAHMRGQHPQYAAEGGV